jgi:hypothetical protein
MPNYLNKAKLKSLMKGFKKREIVEEPIIKPKVFTPAPTKGECPTLAEKPINKKIKNFVILKKN